MYTPPYEQYAMYTVLVNYTIVFTLLLLTISNIKSRKSIFNPMMAIGLLATKFFSVIIQGIMADENLLVLEKSGKFASMWANPLVTSAAALVLVIVNIIIYLSKKRA